MDAENDPFADPYDGPVPEGVDEAAVERMRLVAKSFDDLVTVPGTNVSVGLDPVLGVIPGAGDVVAAGFSLYIVLESARLGVSYGTLVKMLANVTIDVGGGMIPYVGTIIDAAWKSNQRNLALALEDLAEGASDTVFAAPGSEAGAERVDDVDDEDGPVEIPIDVEE